MTSAQLPSPDFIITREYRLFAEFCDACRQARYIGLCYGVPGVGKTVSARQYAHWDELEALLGPAPHRHGGVPPRDSGPWQTVLYTPRVTNTPRLIQREVDALWGTVFGLAARTSWYADRETNPPPDPPDLVIVDEADRVKTTGLEQIRDIYDRRRVGMVLIGMPGLQKRLARYPQLYSRVGFVHQFRPLSGQELQTVIERQSVQLGLGLALHEQTDTAVVNAIARVTGGNFRLVERLFAQIERVIRIIAAATVEEVRTEAPKFVAESEKDLGVDIAAVRRFPDGRAAVPVIFGQCASGRDWTTKLATPDASRWKQLLTLTHTPLKAFSLPFRLFEPNYNVRRSQYQGMLMDRLRLLPSGPEPDRLDGSTQAALVDWLIPRRDWLLANHKHDVS